MTLSDETVMTVLQEKFICGWRDISEQPYCGSSGKHGLDNPALRPDNGAGPTNTQIFILAPDGTVLHCLPGFWDKRDLLPEISLAEELHKVWADPRLSREEKEKRFRSLHLDHLAHHSADMAARSPMQAFDKAYELQEFGERSDCLLPQQERQGKRVGYEAMKTTDRIMHERIARQPFKAFCEFDVAGCVTYGRPHYDSFQDEKPGQPEPYGGSWRSE